MTALLYKESNGFTDFDQVQNNLNQEEYIDFNELLPEQEKVFQMIRSCYWEGDAQPELLELVGLNRVLTTERDVSQDLVASLNRRLRFFHQTSLPDSVTPEAVAGLSWGPSLTNEASKQKVAKMMFDLAAFKNEHHDFVDPLFDAKSRWLLHHLSALETLLDFSKCTRLQRLYQTDIRERLCQEFVPSLHYLSCSFGLLTLGTLMLFVLSFCTGHRVLARLERLEYSDYLNKRRQEEEEEAKEQQREEEEDSCCKKSASFVEAPQQPLLAIFVDHHHQEEEKTMPVYVQQDSTPVPASASAVVVVASAVQEQNQVLDLVYIPPPVYFYGSHPEQQQ